MLTVQVNYQGVQETIRHNKVAEEQNRRSLDQEDVRLQQNWESINETKRHNLATETLGVATLAETSRHNVATETLGYANLAYNYAALAETKRHNIATEGVAWAQVDVSRSQVAELSRHNQATEALTADSNSIQRQRQITDAVQGWSSIANQQRVTDIAAQNAETNRINAETNQKRQEQDKVFGIWNSINSTIDTLTRRQEQSRRAFESFKSIVPGLNNNYELFNYFPQ